MFFRLVISLPLFVCLFWAVFYSCRLLGRRRSMLAEYMRDPFSVPEDTCLKESISTGVNRVLVSFYFTSMLLYLCHYLFFEGWDNIAFETIYIIANLSVYPLFLIYLSRLTTYGKGRGIHDCLLLLPAVVVGCTLAVCAFFGWYKAYDVVRIVGRVCFACLVLWVWIRGSVMLRDFRYMLDNLYSDDRSSRLIPVNAVLHLFGLISFMSMLLNFVGRDWFVGRGIVAVPALLMSVLLYVLGYFTAHLPVPDVSEYQDNLLFVMPEQEEEDAAASQDLLDRLETLMKEEQPYLNPTLSLSDIAATLQTNRTYVSTLINSVYGINFSVYVSRYRIEHAKHILADSAYSNDHEAVLAAIYKSGFSSENTFYRQFRQLTGTTPISFRRASLSTLPSPSHSALS